MISMLQVYLIGKMSDLAKEKAARLLKKRGSLSSLGSHEIKAKETAGKTKEYVRVILLFILPFLVTFILRGKLLFLPVSHGHIFFSCPERV